ncbi:MAG: ankyrin repeat domain-containing protein [Wolbachia sp.]
MLPTEGQINAAANFQAEDFESKNATDLDYLANPLSASNAKLENSADTKKDKKLLFISSRRESIIHTFKLPLSKNANQDENRKTHSHFSAWNSRSRLLKNRNTVNITPSVKILSKVYRSPAIDYSTAESIGSRLLNICKGEEDISFDQEINSLHTKGCLYDVLLLQDEENHDTPLHVAIKRNRTDFVEKLLCILKEPYCSSEFYKRKYFERKQENEKPLFKVINTKNKDEKDAITLAIEGNNSECISALLNYLADKNINREKDVESGYTPLHEAVLLDKNEAIKELLKSKDVDTELIDKESYKACNYANDKEAVELFIQRYSNQITSLRTRLEDNNKKLARIKCVLGKTKLTCVCLAAFGSCFRMYKNSHDIASETVNKDILYYSFELLSNTTGLVLFFNHLIDTILSKYEKENSNLNKEFTSYVKERNMLENRLRYFQKRNSRATTQMSEIISVIPESELGHSRL